MDLADSSLALLARLSSKPGVQSTLILSRTDGAIIRREGLLARNTTSSSRRKRATSSAEGGSSSGEAVAGAARGVNGAAKRDSALLRRRWDGEREDAANDGERVGEEERGEAAEELGEQTGEEVARAVWRYVKATEGLVEEMDAEDEVRLLRVRTRKNEIVVVPSELFWGLRLSLILC
jgi:dynein light chain roadblock-type